MSTNDRSAMPRSSLWRACVSTVTIAASFGIAACGGGGGDGATAPVTSSTPTLTVTADAADTVSSGSAVAVHATLTNSGSTLSWTLDGPGALSASTGSSIDYLPPDAEDFDTAATATITATAGALSQHVQVTLAAVNVPGHHWSVSRASTTAWNSVAYADGGFVAVGDNGGISQSADGLQWTVHDIAIDDSWQSVTNGDAGWLAVGSLGGTATSPDGVTWTQGAPFATDVNTPMTKVIFGNGVYLAASTAQSWISADAITWTPVARGFESIVVGNGLFVGVDSGEIYSSPDGIEWTHAANQFLTVSSMAFANGKFVAWGGGITLSSTDAVTWDRAPDAPPDEMDPILAAGDYFVQSDGNGNGYVLTDPPSGGVEVSADGVTWSARTQIPFGPAVGLAAGQSALVGVAHDGSIAAGADAIHLDLAMKTSYGTLVAVDYADGRYMVLTTGGYMLTSTDALAWTPIRMGPSSTTKDTFGQMEYSMAHSIGGQIVVAGETVNWGGVASANVFTSADGVAWNSVLPPSSEIILSSIVNDGKRFLAIGGSGTVYSSPDGTAWTKLSKVTLASGSTANAMAYGGGHFVIAGLGGVAKVSTDAIHWQTAPPITSGGDAPVPVDFQSVAYTGDGFVAVGASGLVASSKDGLTWTVATSATTETLHGIASSAGGELVAVGDHGLTETSADGIHWTVRAALGTRALMATAFVNGRFMAVGVDGTIDVSNSTSDTAAR